MRTLILLILLFPSVVFAKPMGITSGVFCQSLDGITSLFVALDSLELGGKAKLADFGCARLRSTKPIGAYQTPTYRTVENKGETYHVYMFKFMGSNLTLFGYTDKPSPPNGWDI